MARSTLFLLSTLLLTALAIVGWRVWQASHRARETVRIGVAVATSGPHADFDRPTLEGCAAMVGIINAEGGVLGGRPLELVVRDTAGDPHTAAHVARSLLAEDGALALIGGTSVETRRAMTAVAAESEGLILSPTASEGLDSSDALVTLGGLPNQRAIPATAWAIRTLGPRLFLVMGDDALARVVSALLEAQINALGGTLVGTRVVGADGKESALAIEAARQAHADGIISLLSGTSSKPFFSAMRSANVSSDELPVVSLYLRRGEAEEIDASLLAGHFLVASTFDVETGPMARAFADAYAAKNDGRRPDARATAASGAVQLIALAIDQSGGTDREGIRAAILGARVRSPGGLVEIDAAAHAAWKPARIARILPSGGVREVWTSSRPIRPDPWPIWHSRSEWMRILRGHDGAESAESDAAPAGAGT